MTVNVSTPTRPEEKISKLLTLIGQPVRVQILLVIGAGEACVCHLEAVLGVRQASISQHLMVLREAGLVTTQREGRNIFYRLAQPEVIDLLHHAVGLAGGSPESLAGLTRRPVAGCPCPKCNPSQDPELSCSI